MSDSIKLNTTACPICNKTFDQEIIVKHVNNCLFLHTPGQGSSKRDNSHLQQRKSPFEKRARLESLPTTNHKYQKDSQPSERAQKGNNKVVPLAEAMRPINFCDIVGHKEAFGPGTMVRAMLDQKKIPNMILWGPPGCGKTSFANVVSHICKESRNMRFVKLSATMCGINDVKEIVKVAKNEAQFKHQTILFMDEIHRFNKLQQDTFLPHVENGTIILIGATTENPSFSLNNALLSRCRVIVMQKLSVDDVLLILERALQHNKNVVISSTVDNVEEMTANDIPKIIIQPESLQWLAEICDGDARIALSGLELAITSRNPGKDHNICTEGPTVITLEDIQNGIKRTHLLYDRKGEEHYNIISAIHKSIRASDDNAALYWTTRALSSGEDPLFIARRLIRVACEDIGLADQNALVEAVACLQGCQHIGMPECDVLLVQCAVRLARATKSTEVYKAMKKCQSYIQNTKGPLPPVPLHLRNASTKLMKELGFGSGYNTLQKEESGLTYMPNGMEGVDFFNSLDD